MDWPAELIGTVDTATDEHRSQLEQAITCARQRVRAHPQFDQWREQLIDGMIQRLVYERRAHENVVIKRGPIGEEQPPEVTSASNGQPHREPIGASIAGVAVDIRAAEVRIFNLKYGSLRLGDMTGNQLDRIAESAKSSAAGHLAWKYLRDDLRRRLGDEDMVEECFEEDEVQRKWQAAERKAKRQVRDSRRRRRRQPAST